MERENDLPDRQPDADGRGMVQVTSKPTGVIPQLPQAESAMGKVVFLPPLRGRFRRIAAQRISCLVQTSRNRILRRNPAGGDRLPDGRRYIGPAPDMRKGAGKQKNENQQNSPHMA